MPAHDGDDAEVPDLGTLLIRFVALFIWAASVWLLLTWSTMLEQLVAGAVICLLVAVGLTPLGEVARPWRILRPRTLWAVPCLAVSALGRIVRANIGLSRRIWSPSRPLASGMLVVPTSLRSEGGLATMGLITSLIVDNQIVDLDLGRHEVQFHAIEVPSGTAERVDRINGPVEHLLQPITESR